MKQNMFLTKVRTFLYGLLIFLQFAVIIFLLWLISAKIPFAELLMKLLSIITAFVIAVGNLNIDLKILWLLAILVFPTYGGSVYVVFKILGMPFKKQELNSQIKRTCQNYLPQDDRILKNLHSESETAFLQSNYIFNKTGFPVYSGTSSKLLTPGSEKYSAMLEELSKAEKFIFLEYFIIDFGVMWTNVLEILKQKAKCGLDVRVIYDDFGCKNLIPHDYCKQLASYGIKCKVFNRLKPFLCPSANYRNHRKILVIDGNVGFTGGINIADEYIGLKKPHGEWKDSAIIIKGSGVWSMTNMFLSIWGGEEDRYKFMPYGKFGTSIESDGFIQPYSCTPCDTQSISNRIYLNMIHHARKYIYICVPYLITNGEILSALEIAAQSGVDVRIITPHIGDNILTFTGTRSSYKSLIDCNVRIFEYLPGFIHSKTFVCDDAFAIVGSVNLDYRSNYLMLESAVWAYNSDVVLQSKDDFAKTLLQCEEITELQCKNVPFAKKFAMAMLKILSPLL